MFPQINICATKGHFLFLHFDISWKCISSTVLLKTGRGEWEKSFAVTPLSFFKFYGNNSTRSEESFFAFMEYINKVCTFSINDTLSNSKQSEIICYKIYLKHSFGSGHWTDLIPVTMAIVSHYYFRINSYWQLHGVHTWPRKCAHPVQYFRILKVNVTLLVLFKVVVVKNQAIQYEWKN